MYDAYVRVTSDADIQFSLQLADTVGIKKMGNISLNFENLLFYTYIWGSQGNRKTLRSLWTKKIVWDTKSHMHWLNLLSSWPYRTWLRANSCMFRYQNWPIIPLSCSIRICNFDMHWVPHSPYDLHIHLFHQ